MLPARISVVPIDTGVMHRERVIFSVTDYLHLKSVWYLKLIMQNTFG